MHINKANTWIFLNCCNSNVGPHQTRRREVQRLNPFSQEIILIAHDITLVYTIQTKPRLHHVKVCAISSSDAFAWRACRSVPRRGLCLSRLLRFPPHRHSTRHPSCSHSNSSEEKNLPVEKSTKERMNGYFVFFVFFLLKMLY